MTRCLKSSLSPTRYSLTDMYASLLFTEKLHLGREIADILVAVNRPYGKSDYIPCIAWGRNARFAGGLEVGAHLQVSGQCTEQRVH